MLTLKNSLLNAAAVVTFLGSVAAASPVFAAPQDDSTPSAPPNSSVQLNSNGSVVGTTPDTSATTPLNAPGVKMHHHKDQLSEEDKLKAHVEQRIKTLHDTLAITSDQESTWNEVAEAMRDNETTIAHLTHEHYKHRDGMTAVDDLESYQKIAQAHADGLAKLVPAFKDVYATLSDAQKQNADKIFAEYEGHGKGHAKGQK